MIGFEFRAQVH